jgi:hypothetical protein
MARIILGRISLPSATSAEAHTLDVEEQAEFGSTNRRAKRSQGPVPPTCPSHPVSPPGLSEDDEPLWAAEVERGLHGSDSEDEATRQRDSVRRPHSPVGATSDDMRVPQTVSTASASHRGSDNRDDSSTYSQRQVMRSANSQDHRITSPSPNQLLAEEVTYNPVAQSFAPRSTTASASIQEGHTIYRSAQENEARRSPAM